MHSGLTAGVGLSGGEGVCFVTHPVLCDDDGLADSWSVSVLTQRGLWDVVDLLSTTTCPLEICSVYQ